ncbi:hypothetical protein KY325_03785 [Candidatus Woesearchaeota archaeon]|nr:hypothetical protein [Candidatus Woesearchaeota archaeon]
MKWYHLVGITFGIAASVLAMQSCDGRKTLDDFLKFRRDYIAKHDRQNLQGKADYDNPQGSIVHKWTPVADYAMGDDGPMETE